MSRAGQRAGQPPDDAGVTLVELLVAGLLSLLVGALALSFVLSATASTRRADGQNEQAAAARIGDRRLVRAAPAGGRPGRHVQPRHRALRR